MDCSPLTLFVVISEFVQREMLSRLLRLNHERWEEEQKVKDERSRMKDEEKKGKSKRVKKSKSAGDGQLGLL